MIPVGNNVAQRVRSNAEAMSNGEGRPTLAVSIRNMEQQFAMAMPRGMEAAQLIRDAMTALRTNPKLNEVEQGTALGGLMTCAQLGLRLGVLGHAWLVPFYNSKNRQYEAQLIIGYQGLIELAHRSDRIKSLIARTVYANETFDVDYGLSDNLIHKPTIFGDKGDPIAYYAIAKFNTGGHAFVVMSHEEMLEHRDKYAMAKTREGTIVGPWRDNFEGMALKTTIRRLARWMPKATDFGSAIEADESIRIDVNPHADIPTAIEHVEGELVDAPATQEEPPPVGEAS